MKSSKPESVGATTNGAATGDNRPTAPSPVIDPALFNKAWGAHFAKRKERDKKVAVVIDLPSGEQVAVLRYPLWYMLHHGMIPDRLTAYAQQHVRMLSSGDAERAQQEMLESYVADQDNAQANWEAMLDELWVRCVVAPRFGHAHEATIYADAEGELRWRADDAVIDDPAQSAGVDVVWNVRDVEIMDKIFVYQYCQGVDETVESFLRSTAAAVGVVADGPGFPLPAE